MRGSPGSRSQSSLERHRIIYQRTQTSLVDDEKVVTSKVLVDYFSRQRALLARLFTRRTLCSKPGGGRALWRLGDMIVTLSLGLEDRLADGGVTAPACVADGPVKLACGESESCEVTVPMGTEPTGLPCCANDPRGVREMFIDEFGETDGYMACCWCCCCCDCARCGCVWREGDAWVCTWPTCCWFCDPDVNCCEACNDCERGYIS